MRFLRAAVLVLGVGFALSACQKNDLAEPPVPLGDFALDEHARVQRRGDAPGLTYSTIGLYRPEMVAGIPVGTQAALRPCLDRAIDAGRLSGQRWSGPWVDVGTPERLKTLNAQ